MCQYLYWSRKHDQWRGPIGEESLRELFLKGLLGSQDWVNGPLPSADYCRFLDHPVLGARVGSWALLGNIEHLWAIKRDAMASYIENPNSYVSPDPTPKALVDEIEQGILEHWQKEAGVLDQEILWRSISGSPFCHEFPEGVDLKTRKDGLADFLRNQGLDDKPGSYAFFNGDIALYVGQSAHLVNRLGQHLTREQEYCNAATRILFWRVKLNVGFAMTRHLDLERLLILRYQPMHNPNKGTVGGNYADMQLEELRGMLLELSGLPDRFY